MSAPVTSTEVGSPLLVSSNASSASYSSISVEVPDDSGRVDEMHERLRKVFDSGVTKDIEWRRNALNGLRRLLTENRSDIESALKNDLNKCAFDTWLSEYQFIINEIDEALYHLKSWMAPTKVNTNLLNLPGSSALYKDPLGLVLIISPWNYPLQLLLAPVVGALAAGNTIILKPSELAAHTSRLVARLVPQYLGQYGVGVIEGAIAPTTALLKKRWDLIFYTGGGFVGRIILRAAAEHLTPVILELGGKSPCMILDDANLALAAKRIAWGKWMNAGQTCIAPDYVMISERSRPEFIRHLNAAVEEMYGSNPRNANDFARIISTGHAKRLRGLFEPLEEGLKVELGDVSTVDVDAKYIPPLAFSGVKEAHRMMADEIFGPVLPIMTVNSLDDMISYINRHEKPLALYAFTSDEAAVQRLLKQTSSGGVTINDVIMHIANTSLPFGGVGNSGMGSYHGVKSFNIFSHEKSVLQRSGAAIFDAPQRYPPYNESKMSFMATMVGVQNLALYKPYWYALGGVAAAGVTALLVTKFAAKLW